MSDALKLALVTDIHHGVDSPTKRGSQALAHLAAFERFCTAYQPDLIVEMGDRLNDVNRAEDRERLSELARAFASLPAPHRHLLGNHDVYQLTPEDNAEILGQPMASVSLQMKGWQLVFWQADTRVRDPHHFFAYQPSDLEWLRAELAAAQVPVIVFSHIPLDSGSMRANYYFQNTAHAAAYAEPERVQAVLSESGKVAACVAGHVHWNTLNTVDGIPCFALQSLTEQFTQPSGTTGTWGTLELDETELRFRAHGADPVAYTVPRRDPAQRWVPPVKPHHLRQPTSAPPAGLSTIRGLILDMDGVLYRGEEPISGAVAFVRWWQERGGQIVALTNNARRTPVAYQEKLRRMGIDLPAARILTSADATAAWLLRQTGQPRAFILGSVALRDTLLAAGVEAVTGEAAGVAPDFVVAGYDPGLTLTDLNQAVAHLHRGAHLLASNPDRQVPAPGFPEPECGSVIAYLEAATGKRATVLGKPHKLAYQLALECLDLPPHEVLAVGDTVYTDVAGAVAASLPVALVHTPAPDPGGPGPHPTLALPDLAALRSVLEKAAE